jgi:phosphoribosylformimino-5-aminoimidazole carboxamide ribotide isomerase
MQVPTTIPVVGVIDVMHGRAVHARGGARERYAPVVEAAGAHVDGSPAALARRYRELGVDALYVADLDAIEGREPQDAAVAAVVGEGLPISLDAGVSSVARAQACMALGTARVVVGLETLASWAALGAICDAVGGERVAFSLDLTNGVPLASGTISGGPEQLAAEAAGSGAGAIIVLDLARVGQGEGLDVALVARVRAAAPGVTLIAGGGVRGRGDLHRLAAAGCDAALVATALHTGALGDRHDSVRR